MWENEDQNNSDTDTFHAVRSEYKKHIPPHLLFQKNLKLKLLQIENETKYF